MGRVKANPLFSPAWVSATRAGDGKKSPAPLAGCASGDDPCSATPSHCLVPATRSQLYFAWTMVTLAHDRVYAPLPFFVLYLFGFLYVGVLSLVHAQARR